MRCQLPEDLSPPCFPDAMPLEIKASQIRAWMNSNKTALAKIQTLRLTNLGLTTVPPEIQLFFNLRSLCLSFNKLTGLPFEIQHLSKLGELHLSSNNFSSFPDEICSLEHLTHLNCAYNQMSSLPGSFSKLVNLSYLNLQHNQFCEMPNFRYLPNLKNLQILYNPFKKTPDFHSSELSLLPNTWTASSFSIQKKGPDQPHCCGNPSQNTSRPPERTVFADKASTRSS